MRAATRRDSEDVAERAGGLPRANIPPMPRRPVPIPRGSIKFELNSVRQMHFVIYTGGFKNLRNQYKNAECMQWTHWPQAREVRDAMEQVVSLCSSLVICFRQRR